MPTSLRRMFVLIFLVAAPVRAADAGGAPSSAAPDTVVVDAKKGDQWVYDFRDGLTNELRFTNSIVISAIAENEIDARWRVKNVATSAESSSLVAYDRLWRKKEDQVWSNDPYQENWGIPKEIRVGASWDYSYVATRQNPPAEVRWTGHAKVAAWERVALLSGVAYDAFRIEYSEAVSSNGKPSATSANIVEWFAPAANRYVKRETNSYFNGKLYDGSVETLTGYVRHDVD